MKKVKYIPAVHAEIYRKLTIKVKGRIVRTFTLKEIINHTIKMPKVFIDMHINDMMNMGLIKRIDHTKFRILKSDCTKKLDRPKCFPFK